MHDTAFAIGASFFQVYVRAPCTILEIGAMNVNGSLRDAAPDAVTYIGLDLEPGPGVDLVTAPGAALPLRDGAVDVTIASSVFEHDRQFWRTFTDMCRVTRPGGYIYINAPSNGQVHSFPLDCWRFYPDAGIALEQLTTGQPWSTRLVESFIADRQEHGWNDFVAVFRRDGDGAPLPAARLHASTPCRNIYDAVAGERPGVDSDTEDMRLLATYRACMDAQAHQLVHEADVRDRRIAELEPALAAAQATAEQSSHQLTYLAAINADLRRQLDSLHREVDTFRSSWTGRFCSLWYGRSRRSTIRGAD